MRLAPFKSLRPPVRFARDVAAPPYDTLDTEEAKALAAGNGRSFLHVEKSEIDFPQNFDAYSPEVYARAAANLAQLESEGALIREPEESFYVYRLQMGSHVQHGVVGCCHIEDYEKEIIRKHEKTREDKEQDRTRHVGVLGANAGPVFLAYRDAPAIDDIVRRSEQASPIFDFVSVDGVQHTAWKATLTGELRAAFAAVPVCYIADGHHRAAAASNVGRARRLANPGHTGGEDYNFFLGVLFPVSQLQILSINRCVLSLNGMDAATFLRRVSETFTVTAGAPSAPSAPGHVSLFLAGEWYGLSWAADASADPVSRLDVSVLQNRLLDPILGIKDPRRDERIEFVGGIRGTEELAARVRSGRAVAAFSMFPVTMEQVMAIADAGRIMPPKSTWFEPKLRSGLFVHTFQG